MWPVSHRFRSAVQAPHAVVAAAELYTAGRLTARSSELRISDGSIKVDATAATRRSFDGLSLAVPERLLPTLTKRTALDPYGNEIRLSRGIRYPDGSVELVPQGVFRLETCEVVDGPVGRREVTISGFDRSYSISQNGWTTSYVITAGTLVTTAIAAIITNRLPGTEVVNRVVSGEVTATHVLDEDSDPWTDGVQMLALLVGAEVYFDQIGRAVIAPVPDPSPPPVLTLAEGPGCVITKLGRTYDASTAKNRVIMTCENGQGVPLRAVADDTDPASPTFIGGPFGVRVLREKLNAGASQDALSAAARARLLQLCGASEQVDMEIVPNSALDAGDVVAVTRLRAGLDGDLLIPQGFDLPLVYDKAEQIQYRTRRLVPA